MIKIKGVRALDELAGPNKGKIRLLSRAAEKRYSKGEREGPRHRAERVAIINEMTTESRGSKKYGSEHNQNGKGQIWKCTHQI
jgi:hypothetical protein